MMDTSKGLYCHRAMEPLLQLSATDMLPEAEQLKPIRKSFTVFRGHAYGLN